MIISFSPAEFCLNLASYVAARFWNSYHPAYMNCRKLASDNFNRNPTFHRLRNSDTSLPPTYRFQSVAVTHTKLYRGRDSH